jgi:hypothetical protein
MAGSRLATKEVHANIKLTRCLWAGRADACQVDTAIYLCVFAQINRTDVSLEVPNVSKRSR